MKVTIWWLFVKIALVASWKMDYESRIRCTECRQLSQCGLPEMLVPWTVTWPWTGLRDRLERTSDGRVREKELTRDSWFVLNS